MSETERIYLGETFPFCVFHAKQKAAYWAVTVNSHGGIIDVVPLCKRCYGGHHDLIAKTYGVK